MCRLQLYFTSGESPELVETRFVRESIEKRSIRGRTSIGSIEGTFLWSPAVRALALLAVKSAEGENAELRGGSASAASSLDFAMNKDPAWLSDIFGCDVQGRVYAHRLIRRINPGRKRAGDVTVQFDRSRVDIEIFVGSRRVSERQELGRISRALEVYWRGPVSSMQSNDQVERFSPQVLKDVLTDELQQRLSERFFACEFERRNHLKRIRTNESFLRVAGRKGRSIQLDSALSSPSASVGVYDHQGLKSLLERRGGVRVSLPLAGLFPTFSIFHFLTANRGLLFTLDWRYQHAVELVSRLVRGDLNQLPELCVLGEAPSATLLQSSFAREYFPLCFLPSNRVQVVRKRRSQVSELPRRLTMLMSDPSNASFYFDRLQASRLISQQVQLIHSEPLQTQTLLNDDPDLGAVLFAPYADLQIQAFGSSEVEHSDTDSGNFACLLWAHRSLLEEKHLVQLIVASINDAWIRLGSDAALRTNSVNSIFNDDELLTALSRYTGIWQAA